jgi:hypothetical protein
MSRDERLPPELGGRRFLFSFHGGMVAEETQTPQPKPSARFDGNDLLFYAGLLLLGVGLAFAVSWPVALVVIGATLAVVGLVNSYVIVWKSR